MTIDTEIYNTNNCNRSYNNNKLTKSTIGSSNFNKWEVDQPCKWKLSFESTNPNLIKTANQGDEVHHRVECDIE